MKSKVLSIYLPQFHAIPENDQWWGKGFTEWTNVRRGRPFYPGHYQPREPFHDNYYDLSDMKVLEKHTRMARKAGLAGFCFYHYYFCGKKLLEKPIEAYRDHSKESFPYCLIWANQSWMRTWYRAGTKKMVLQQQNYGSEADWEKHFYYLLDFFKDERYIKIDEKPVYVIYLPQDIRCRKQMFALWQKLAKKNGFSGIYLIAMNTSYGKDQNTALYDAFMDFEPLSLLWADSSWRQYLQNWKAGHTDSILEDKKILRNSLYTQNTFSYSYLCHRIEKKVKTGAGAIYPGVFAGWDNTPRKDADGVVVRGSTPQKFERHLEKMLELSARHEKKYIFLNAWNEWSEGAYVEPDKRYGYAYLNAIRNAVYRDSRKA